MAEGYDVAVHHRLNAAHRLQLLFVKGGVGERRLQEVMVVKSAVCHGTVETAYGPDTDGEGFGLQRPPDVIVALGLKRKRGRRAETL